MTADAVEIEHGPRIHRAYAEDTLLSNKGIQFSVEDDKNDGFIEISNETLNKAQISTDATIVIIEQDLDANVCVENEYGDTTITLYKLSKQNAV